MFLNNRRFPLISTLSSLVHLKVYVKIKEFLVLVSYIRAIDFPIYLSIHPKQDHRYQEHDTSIWAHL